MPKSEPLDPPFEECPVMVVKTDPFAYRKERPPVPPNMLVQGDPLKKKEGNTLR